MKSNKPVLLVEDDRIDAMTVQRAVKDLKISNPVKHVSNGVEGIEYLRNRDNQKPCIVLLDLNMPKMNGIEFLNVVKSDADLRKIPVVVLTTSSADRDRSESFNLGIAGYMLKPVDYKRFVDVIREIEMYWSLSELPE